MNPVAWKPEGDLTIPFAADHHKALLAWMTECPTNLKVADLSNVVDIDSSGIQLLLSAARACESAGGSLTVSGMHDGVKRAFALYGLEFRFSEVQNRGNP
jgi:anti-sigma B factor antagonist